MRPSLLHGTPGIVEVWDWKAGVKSHLQSKNTQHSRQSAWLLVQWIRSEHFHFPLAPALARHAINYETHNDKLTLQLQLCHTCDLF